MDQQQATNFVIQELGKHHSKNDIIEKLCDATGMNWGEAEKFLRNVETQHSGAIAQKQSPLVVIIGTISVIAGLALSLGIAYETLNGLVIFFLSFPVPYLGNITYFVIGIGMVAGGLRGMWETLVRMWNG